MVSPCALARREEPLELGAHGVGQQHLLGDGLLRGALEHAQGDAALGASGVVEHVADVEREELVLAQARAHREAEDDVVPEAVDVLAGDLEQRALLGLGQRLHGARDGVGVGGHGRSPCDPYRLPFARKARSLATSRRAA
jgi:hypothetical protein